MSHRRRPGSGAADQRAGRITPYSSPWSDTTATAAPPAPSGLLGSGTPADPTGLCRQRTGAEYDGGLGWPPAGSPPRPLRCRRRPPSGQEPPFPAPGRTIRSAASHRCQKEHRHLRPRAWAMATATRGPGEVATVKLYCLPPLFCWVIR